ncbi:PepSY domain-containing protein [Alkalihalobacillus sp. LMS39]|uniref:PepSY-associated TM helix domain-containing protein n=1 Tax=Alkalihalobacillus sp. LMS39 TaxID=2924032 RepID=UPI001FB55CBE|nr:PepSY domain-containing protein [Alkalihalobacillus sp. LMS39]UOE95021.1 PepSY domain-containing protein [Alkalihalobacillus sp. LMS39]
MELSKMQQPDKTTKQQNKKDMSLYRAVWRWHFYAGIIFAPFLIILAISGGVYLFKPQIENMLYQDLFYVTEAETTASPSHQLQNMKREYPESIIRSIRYYEQPRTTEFSIINHGEAMSVYVNPYTGEITGSLMTEKKFTEIFKKIHSELFIGGTWANRVVELAACWAIILLVTGLYIWWPREKKSIWGTILPRLNKRGRTLWRDLHVVPAFWLSAFILILILTGLPWSGVMGEQINKVATATNTGYPPFALSFREKPESVVKTKDVADDVPWATENLAVPVSTSGTYVSLSLEDVNYIAKTQNVQKPYTISLPQGETGVYTIATSHSRPGDNATLHVDQYSGAVITDVRFQDYGIMAKAITLGIALHEGRLFGLPNQILGLITCIGLVGLIVSSFVMWRNRKPSGKLGAPPKPKSKKQSRVVLVIMIGFGLLMPLVGISIIVVLILDRFLFSKINRLREWYE